MKILPSQRFLFTAGVAAAALLLSTRADAFKWRQCPPPSVPLNPSTVGATNSPFVHPGHEITIVLNQAEVERSGGFGTAPNGNTIIVTFVSLFGDPIGLAPTAATATSPASLTFNFPDARAEVGRTLAGPVQISVRVGDSEVAHISPEDFVALPAAVDLTPILEGAAADEIVPAALGIDGDLWVPASFSGHPMGGMPGCDSDTAFIMKAPIEISGATVVGSVLAPFPPTDTIRRISGYLGDITLNGASYYGLLYPEQIDLEQVGGTLGVSVCRLNDATSLVLRIQGNQSWALPESPFRLVARDSTPLALSLHKAAALPRSSQGTASARDTTAPGRIDSFGNQCAQLPTKGSQPRVR